MTLRPRFHLAFGVTDLAHARRFYVEVLGCQEGRAADRWVDFDFHGHQLSAHLVDNVPEAADAVAKNDVDGDAIVTRHFGLILDFATWDDLVARLNEQDQTFLVPPKVRFAGEPGEQRTFFICDPAGNALEFKAFDTDASIFAR